MGPQRHNSAGPFFPLLKPSTITASIIPEHYRIGLIPEVQPLLLLGLSFCAQESVVCIGATAQKLGVDRCMPLVDHL